jgi:phosphatidate cytidylyltransferase
VSGRIAVAIPGILVAIGVVYVGGPLFVAAALVIALLGVYEYLNLVAGIDPLRWAAYVGTAITVALPGFVDTTERAVLAGLVACIGLGAAAGILTTDRDEITLRVTVTMFGAFYLGLPLGLFVATRELTHGAAAVANVLVGTWAFDTFSYFGGRLWGRHPVAPLTSPNKTVEGLYVGFFGATIAVAVAGLYMDWIDALDSFALGAVICAAAFAGDLFESLIKRDVGVKDSGRLLGAHGGVLDRFDALLFSAPAAYLATVWLV